MSDKTLDDVILEAVRPLSDAQKRQLLSYIEHLEDQESAPTLVELLAMPYDERNQRAKQALERSQMYEHDDLEGYTDADFDDSADTE